MKKGIPNEVRTTIWSTMIGNKLRITPKLFEIFKEKV